VAAAVATLLAEAGAADTPNKEAAVVATQVEAAVMLHQLLQPQSTLLLPHLTLPLLGVAVILAAAVAVAADTRKAAEESPRQVETVTLAANDVPSSANRRHLSVLNKF
jgi:hypothetical protein